MATPVDLRSRIASLERPGLVEHWISVAPDVHLAGTGQIASLYEGLDSALDSLGAGPAHVIRENVHCASVDEAAAELDRTRNRFFVTPPPAMYIEQPPAAAGCVAELQAYVAVPTDEQVERPDPLPEGVEGALYRVGAARHVHLSGLTGFRPDAEASVERETELVFERAAQALSGVGMDFTDVVRTWIYLPDLERDYDTLNKVRTAFFREVGVTRIPASTGIQGRVFPSKRGPGISLYAIDRDPETTARVMHAETMNEASSYGSAFSRGMTVTSAGTTLAYISGTASIDEQGRIFGSDIDTQLGRMFDNVAALLRPVDGDLSDAVSTTVYLKDRAFLPALELAWNVRGLPDTMPLTVVVADVCRPGWLCEMEAIVPVETS